MGMFDTIHNEQVKCFPVTMTDVRDDGTIHFYKSGGSMKYFRIGDKVPHQTPYYNYGDTFAIFDYTNILYEMPQVIVVLDGRVSAIHRYDKVPKATYINVVIDNYGNLTKVHTAQDCINIVDDYTMAYNVFDDTRKEYSKSKSFTKDSHSKSIQEFARLRELAFAEFNEKWGIAKDDDRLFKIYDNTNVGAVISHIIKFPWDEEKIISAFNNYLGNNKQRTIDQYKNWLKLNNISIYDEIVKKI